MSTISDEAALELALTTYNKAAYEWTSQSDPDEPRHRYAMRKALLAIRSREQAEHPAGGAVDALDGELWSFLRKVLCQGEAIQADNDSGRFDTHEEHEARLDEAARERAAQFADLRTPPLAQVPDGWKLMPVHWTGEMRAAFQGDSTHGMLRTTVFVGDFAERYTAMLAAAPTPPSADQ